MANADRIKKHWTAEELEKAKEMLAGKMLYSEIARALGRSPASIHTKLSYGKRNSKPKYKAERVMRACLRCRNIFTAKGPYNRLCYNCTNYARENHSTME